MSISFPLNPDVNDTYSENGRSYIWTGYAWEFLCEVTNHSHTIDDIVDFNFSNIADLGTVSGSTSINCGSDRSIQTLTLDGTATTFTKGSGWPTLSTQSADVVLKITVSNPTTITWNIVTEWYNQPSAGALSVGTHLFLLRSIGTSVMEGHYIGNKTN